MVRLFGTLALALAAASNLTGAANAGLPFSEVVVFGDSISDTGNAFLFTDGAAAGAPYFQGRFSNGPVWVEVLARGLGLPAPAPSLGGGTNYAWGGAETGSGLSVFGTPNVGLQIEFFLADRGRLAGDELVVVAAGSNDLASQPPHSPARVVRNLSAHIAALAAAGGRTFLVPNLPSPGQNPANRGTPREVYFDTLTTVVNRLLDRQLPLLEEELGITIVRFDMDGVVDAMFLSPQRFGLMDVTDPACPGCGRGFPSPDAADTMVPNPDEYLWWDFVHMTRVAHAVIGRAAAELAWRAGRG
jgi:3-phytase